MTATTIREDALRSDAGLAGIGPAPKPAPSMAMQQAPAEEMARLLFSCPARHEAIPKVTDFLHRHGAIVTGMEEHWTDIDDGLLFMRVEFRTRHLTLSAKDLSAAFAREIGAPFNMDWRIGYASRRKRMAILVSKYDHALMELLWLHSRGALACDISMVISNHPDLGEAVARFGIPFHVVPVTRDTKGQAEGKTDLVVLARYMQVLTGDFIRYYPNRIINIHHSFLPAFKGANPYRQAHERGVKLIGATAHYVTEDLDMGPIIEQDVQRVSHRRSVDQLREQGEMIERATLARAVRWDLEDRIIVYDNKTVVFYG